jgi:ubiquinone/menaquinone biosynthesis C-methylase UbiE
VGRSDADYDLWQQLAARWDRRRDLLQAPLRELSAWLVDRLDPRPGETILELAAGTGETGFLAAARLGPTGRLLSSDRSPNMVEAARRAGAELGLENVDYRVLDAERLELADGCVDGVLSRFGYVLRGDPPPALREIRRVLRPGRRFAFAVWAERALNPWMTVPAAVMVDLGHMAPRAPDRGDPFARRSVEHTAALLADAGFAETEVEELPVTYRFADADELWTFASELRGPVALAIERLSESDRADVRAELEVRAERTADGGYVLGGVGLAAVAR